MSDVHGAGGAWLEVRLGRDAARTVPLSGPLTIGRDVGAPAVDDHLTIPGDASVSRLHAILEHRGPGWCVQAPAVPNGLFVNGNRLNDGAVHLLASGDEIRMGERTVIVFRSLSSATPDRSKTQVARAAPELTTAERRVLLSLCSPLMDGDMFTPPAKVAAIADQLFVTESAVKQHLGRLFHKFDVDEHGDRRVRLANEVMQRGVLRRADLDAFKTSLG